MQTESHIQALEDLKKTKWYKIMRITNYSQAIKALEASTSIAQVAEVEVRVARLNVAGLVDDHQVVRFYGECTRRKIQLIAGSDSFASGDSDELEAAFQAARAV